MFNARDLFSSTVLFSEIDVNQICCGSNAMKDRRDFHVDNWDSHDQEPFMYPKNITKTSMNFISTDQVIILQVKDCLWLSIYRPLVLSVGNYS